MSINSIKILFTLKVHKPQIFFFTDRKSHNKCLAEAKYKSALFATRIVGINHRKFATHYKRRNVF